MRRGLEFIIGLALFLLAGCEGINCSIENIASLNIGFYEGVNGKSVTVLDTLTVTAVGTDSVLFNSGVSVQSLSLPMSYWQDADTLNITFRDTLSTDYTITLRIEKTNQPHYESPDCPTTMFHEIKSLTLLTENPVVDSVVMASPMVNFKKLENVKIYLHTTP